MSAPQKRQTLVTLLRVYNLAAVARELHIDVSTIYRWRDGRSKPSGELLQELARFLRIDANDILLEDDDV